MKGKKFALWSLAILAAAVVITILLLESSWRGSLAGIILLLTTLVCPVVSIVLGIFAVHAARTPLTVIALALPIVLLALEIVFIWYMLWMLESACVYLTDENGELWETMRACGRIG